MDATEGLDGTFVYGSEHSAGTGAGKSIKLLQEGSEVCFAGLSLVK